MPKKVRRGLPYVLVGAIVLTTFSYALIASGYPIRKLDLNDTGIWISNDAGGEYGRVNKAVGALDAMLSPPGQRLPSYHLDILQDGNTVLGWDQSGAKLTRIETATTRTLPDQALGVDPTSSLSMRGGTLAVLDRSGRAWATRYDAGTGVVDLAALSPTNQPLAELGLAADSPQGSAALTVGVDGTIWIAGVNGRLIKIPVEGVGFGQPAASDDRPELKSITLTAVGDSVVALDAKGGQLVLPNGKSVQVEPDGVSQLQQPGPAAEAVLVANSKSLVRVRLDSGALSALDTAGDGPPASPVRMAGCNYSAWAGAGRVIRACDNSQVEVQQVDRTGGLTRPVFRINHSQLLLNDQANGRAYDLETKTSVDDWPDPKSKDRQQKQKKTSLGSADAKPKAIDDDLKARTERTTILHVLDNDTDTAGGILSIKKLNVADVPRGVQLEVSPDGQTVKLYLPAEMSAPVRFSYTISNGRAEDEGRVTLANAGSQQTSPVTRPNLKPVTYAVASFGNIGIPVADDWRDPEGDPVTVLSATDQDGAAIPVTAAGQIDFTADETATDTERTISYQVTDGLDGTPVAGKVQVQILGRKSTTMVAAKAQPDVARGEVGKPIAISPLANDVPGADPRDLGAQLTLNAPVAQKANIEVTTDEKSGQVVATATKEGPYFLEYVVAFGNAALSRGTIRVDVLKSEGADAKPVAMPDQAAIRGRAPVMVDVLANDYDPSGDLLTVASTNPADPDQLQAQVVSGRWLRILPQTDRIKPNPQAVHYTISNGSQTSAGDVLVTQLGEVEQDAALARKDSAVVREGDSVLVQPLTNDTSLSGQPLRLVTDNLGTDHDGQLPVYDRAKKANEDQGDVGKAFVRGDQIRYVAPAKVDGTHQVVISYTVQTNDGDAADSQVVVTIKPKPSAEDPNLPPTAGTVETRVVSGSRISIPIPTTGQDPDGDSVTVVGVGSAPRLGRVVGISPNSLIYEAYPTAGLVGTDTFRYVVADAYGRSGVGSVRVAVTAPGQTQPPVAIDDQLTTNPGADVRVNVLINDYVDRDDSVTVAPLNLLNEPMPAGVSLADKRGPVLAKAPGTADQPVLINYALTGNGGTGPAATIKIVAKEGFNNPPIVVDQVAKIDGPTGSADLLTNAWDVDGKLEDLQVQLLTEVEGAELVEGALKLPLLDHTQVIPYQVSDADGGVTAAVVYVPAQGAGAPRLKQGGSISLATNTSASFSIGDYVESPAGKTIRISSATIDASPEENLAAKVDDPGKFSLTSTNDYVGPASVTVEVMDSGSLTDEGVLTATVTIPVQIGDRTPVLRCPTDPQPIVQGGEVKDLDIATLCHVWSPDPDSISALTYSASWQKPIDGVSATGGGAKVALQAAGSAPERAAGVLVIGIEGTAAKTATLPVVVAPASAPKLRSVRFNDILASTPVSVPISLASPLRDAHTKIVKVEQVGGGSASLTHDDASVTITPGAQTSGTLTFRVVATDLAADPGRQSRWASGTITLVVYSKPGPPGAPKGGPSVQSHAATLSWTPGKANGAAIDSYELRASTGKTFTCRSTGCRVTGLENGKPVTFTVRAHNKAGWGDPSPVSKPIIPDAAPGAPAWVKVSEPQNLTVLVSWGKITNDGSPIRKIHISFAGKEVVAAPGASSKRVAVPSNNQQYTFSVSGENDYDIGPGASAKGQSSGVPSGLAVQSPDQKSSVGASTQVAIAWSLGSAEGPTPVTYSVVRSDGKSVCRNATKTACTDDTVKFDGATYTYKVTATNATGGAAHTTTASSPAWKAVGTPDKWGSWTAAETASNGQVKLSFTVPPSRGASSKLSLLNHGSSFKTLSSPGPGGSAGVYTVTGLDNGTSYSFALKVCNEIDRCSTSAAKSATPFGPLSKPSVSASADGQRINVSASGNGNGATATLTLYVDGAQVDQKSGKGALSVSQSITVGYDQSRTVTAKLTTGSTSPGRSNGGEDSTTVRTGGAPKTVTVDQSGTIQTYSGCLQGCRRVVISLSGFEGPTSCSIWHNHDGTQQMSSYNASGNGTFTATAYFGHWGYQVWAVCGGVESNHKTFTK